MKILGWQYDALVALEREPSPLLTLADALIVSGVDDLRWSKLVMRSLVAWQQEKGWQVTTKGKRSIALFEKPAQPHEVRLSPRQWETLTRVIDPERKFAHALMAVSSRVAEKLEDRGMIQRTSDLLHPWRSTDYGRRVWMARFRPDLLKPVPVPQVVCAQ